MDDILQEYNRKRHFDQTGEPRGVTLNKRSKWLRFVVQHHMARADHYDFRLEWEGVLKSWALPKGPSYDTRDKRLAVQVEDHPLGYRTFEGTIPKGEYGGGTVMVWDAGEWTPLEDPGQGLAKGSLKFTLEGNRLKGRWALVRMKSKPEEKNVNWLLIKEKDEYEQAYDIKQFTTSITSGRTMDEIRAGKPAKRQNSGEFSQGKPEKAASKRGKKPADRSGAGVEITHPEKILYKSGITKGDVAGYYQKIAKRMMPYLENRVLSVVRCPGGIESACFFKKHPATGSRAGVAVAVPGNDGTIKEYVYVTDAEGLMSEVQMNTLEFHTWGSRVEDLEKPDVMVFDLDPDEGMDLERIRQGVRDLKDLLDQLSLTSFLKTSGGKGYHVVIPFLPESGWDVFHEFARNTARAMEAKWPDRYTSNIRKNRRNNRIFIDWMRNGRGATSIAPYSLRAREGAPVSMPIAWKELDTVTPGGIFMEDAIKRLRRKDPWDGFFDTDQRIK